MAAMPAPVTAVAPAHLLRLEMLDLLARRDGGMGVRRPRQAGVFVERMRREWRSIGARGEGGGSGGNTESDLEKVAAFHGISPVL